MESMVDPFITSSLLSMQLLQHHPNPLLPITRLSLMHITDMGNITTIIISFCVINKNIRLQNTWGINTWGKIVGEKSVTSEHL